MSMDTFGPRRLYIESRHRVPADLSANFRDPLFHPAAQRLQVYYSACNLSGTPLVLANVQSMTLRIRESRTAEGILAESTASSITSTVTPASWSAGTHQHALFDLSAAQMNLLDGSTEKAKLWITIQALIDDGGTPYTLLLLADYFELWEDGSSAADPPPENPGTAVTLEEVAALIDVSNLPEGGNTGDRLVKASNDDYDVEWVLGTGDGDVVGPSSATTGNLPTFADGTGKLLQDSGTSPASFATAAQGTDSREWTASTVSQAEAQAGTATTRRAWTAQRVAQAIAALTDRAWTSLTGNLTLSQLNTAVSDATLDDATAARTPTAHKSTHATAGGDPLSPADIGAEVAGAAATVAGDLSAHELLTTTAHGGIVASDDSRLTDARTPTAHAASHVTGGGDKIRDATASQDGLATAAQITKLDGIATGANLYTHPNHSGDVTSVGDGATTIANGAVTFAKIQNIDSQKLIGRHGGGSGSPQEVGVGNGLEFSGSGIRRSALTGDVTASAGDNATTIANDAVTNPKLANMAEGTIKGRIASGAGDPEDLSATDARTVIGAAATSHTHLSADITDLRTVGLAHGLFDSATDAAGVTVNDGALSLSADGTIAATLDASGITANRAFALPNASGTIALAGAAPTAHAASHVTGGDDKIRDASASQDGLATAAQITKLDGIATGANNYTHPNHSGDVTSTGDGATAIAATAISGKTELSTPAGTEQALVNDGGTLKRVTLQDIADLGGGGGGGLDHFDEARSTAAPNATVPAHSLTAAGTETNIDATFSPKGTGAFSLNVADNTSAGGNKRGARAVDLQTSRTGAAQVASGDRSAIVGGQNNTASGLNSAVFGGAANAASGNGAVAIGGNGFSQGGGTASGVDSATIGVESGLSSAPNTLCAANWGGRATSDQAVAIGGFAPVAHLANMQAQGCSDYNSNNSATARANSMSLRWFASTTNATQTEMGIYRASFRRAVLETHEGWAGTLVVQGQRSGSADWGSRHYQVHIVRDGSTVSAAINQLGSDMGSASGLLPADWEIDVDADTSNNALRIRVTGVAAQTIRWSAFFSGATIRHTS